MPNRDWITKDFTWKLFSLILAVALWITVHRSIGEAPTAVTPFASVNTVTFTNLPVSAVSTSTDVHNAQVVPNLINVKVSGPSDIMAGLQKNEIHAMVNLTGIDSARGLRLNVDVSTPPGVALGEIDPPRVSVTISPPTE
jgi:YbbR domain-containing protein